MEISSVSIIIQGQTKYYIEMIASLRNIENIVWCTWNDEPIENINSIRASGMYVHQIGKPMESGFWNINYQCKSTYEGLIKCKELYDTKYYIKIRSDFQISNISLLCENFIEKNECLNYLGWSDSDDGYFLDYIVFGDFISMEKYWNINYFEDNGYPCPEKFLMKHYFNTTYLTTELKMKYRNKLPKLNKIQINWLKYGLNIRDINPPLNLNYTEEYLYYCCKFLLFKIKIQISKILFVGYIKKLLLQFKHSNN